MTDTLHQINVRYVGKEDRLLMRATTQNGDEYRIWLTRRFTGLLNNILDKAMDKHGGAPSIGSAPQTQKLFKAGALEKKFEEEKTSNFPLGEKGILAFAIKSSMTPKGDMILELLPEKGKGLTFTLNHSMLYLLHNLISQGIDQAEWYLGDSSKSASSKVH